MTAAQYRTTLAVGDVRIKPGGCTRGRRRLNYVHAKITFPAPANGRHLTPGADIWALEFGLDLAILAESLALAMFGIWPPVRVSGSVHGCL